jgi:peptidoglycan/LPS O-acetylase OafA/YrhL
MPIGNKGQTVPEGSPYARHLPPLDGIRGLAVLGVAGSHLFPGNAHSAIEDAVRSILGFGSAGVDLFFVLSGFLITGILYDSLPDPKFFRKFYARRVLRIFPLYYGVLASFGLAALVFGLNFHNELLSLALYLQNTSLIAPPIRNYTGPTMLPLPHFWTLAIEEQFYFVWPITVFFLRHRRRLLIFCISAILFCPLLRIALLLHGMNFFLVQSNTVCRADSLLAGGALALLLRSRIHDIALRAGGWLFVGGLLTYNLLKLLLSGRIMPISPSDFLIILSLIISSITAASTGLIALALHAKPFKIFFSIKPMRWIGRYSYGIYILHLILFTYLEEPVRKAIRSHLTADKGVTVVLSGLLIFCISLLCAYLSYNLYEKRFLRLKRFFDYRPHVGSAN